MRRTPFHRRPTLALIAALAACLVAAPVPVRGEVNQALGGIGGLNNGTLTGGDGSGEAQVTLTATTLALVKQARDLAGTVLPNGSSVSGGQVIYFVLYVDNTTAFDAEDIRLTDLLDEARFTYVPGSLEANTVPSGSNDSQIWTLGSWTALSDGTADDEASATDTGGPAGFDRITAGNVTAQPNAVAVVTTGTLRAYRFRVTVN